MADSVTVQSENITVYIQDEADNVVSISENPSSTSVTDSATSSTSVSETDTSVSVYEGIPLSGGGDLNYTQSFTAQTSVTVTHNLGKKPAVSIYDSAGDEVTGDIEYTSNNQLTVTFSSAFTGTIILN